MRGIGLRCAGIVKHVDKGFGGYTLPHLDVFVTIIFLDAIGGLAWALSKRGDRSLCSGDRAVIFVGGQ